MMLAPDALKDRLTLQLEEEQEVLTHLLTILHDETEVLAESSADRLLPIIEAKHQAVSFLEQTGRSRSELLAAHGHTPIELPDILDACDESGNLKSRFEDNLEMATRCRQVNLDNGIIINKRESVAAKSLRVLTGNSEVLYTSGGDHPLATINRSLGSA
jgi:flagellar biosynthesis/type III secretory pathway chaperone